VLLALPRFVSVLLAFVTVVGCGKRADRASGKKDAGAAPVAAPISLPVLGVDRLGRFNFVYGDGAKDYGKATAAAEKNDWDAVRSHAEAALAKDPYHLDAHQLLARALVRAGEPAAAVDHLVTAIAGDYFQYGRGLAKDDSLSEFLATEHGQAVGQLAQQIQIEYSRRIADGVWLVGRRSAFRWPAKPGAQPGTSRGELYAFDPIDKRYLRLSHSGHQVSGFVRSRAGTEVALLGYDRVERGKDADAPPALVRAWIQVLDAQTWEPATAKITLGPARAVAVGWGDGDQLVVATAPASGRWGLGAWTASAVDRSTGKLTKIATAMPAPRIELSLDEGRVVPPLNLAGVTAAWTGDPPRAPALEVGGAKIAIPESGQAAHETIALAPDGAHVAFATAVDPCSPDTAPSLYVATARSGALKHVLTAKSRFATRWLDATTLAYDDGEGGIRLWDATTGREAQRLENKVGIALDVLSLASAPLCKQAPPTAEPDTGDEMPPEESGPVTRPE
jgi:hypothetical protein